MPIEATWHNAEESIAYWRFDGDWSWDEYFALLPETVAIGEQKPYPITVIMDFTTSNPNIKDVLGMFRLGERQSANNIQQVVFVGNMFVRTMVDAYRKINVNPRYPIYSVFTLENALSLIQKQRQNETTT